MRNALIILALAMNSLVLAAPLTVLELPDGARPWGDGHLVVVAGHGPAEVLRGNEYLVRLMEDVYAD